MSLLLAFVTSRERKAGRESAGKRENENEREREKRKEREDGNGWYSTCAYV